MNTILLIYCNESVLLSCYAVHRVCSSDLQNPVIPHIQYLHVNIFRWVSSLCTGACTVRTVHNSTYIAFSYIYIYVEIRGRFSNGEKHQDVGKKSSRSKVWQPTTIISLYSISEDPLVNARSLIHIHTSHNERLVVWQ